ncbi:hypothetical protein [Streptomyces sp. XD-27]|uniref:hypothetical protein n=1 Tax=Streptomyces sp. XD-27 TaxID=3062779 RepID=UPI0026F42C6C|nr:hypothetical protein [Streptomyces sp. XD-27]WKX74243.1 hypothetical protein Q3Y56_12635 [Streptomyces sp. XD-27]
MDNAGRVTAVRARGWNETYAYDEAGNQTQATRPTGHPPQGAAGDRAYTGTRWRYLYDPFGRRHHTGRDRRPLLPDRH